MSPIRARPGDPRGRRAGTWPVAAEALEGRTFLSGALSAGGDGVSPASTAPARVSTVFVSGTSWTPAFRQALTVRGTGEAAFGFRVGQGAGALATLPWSGVNQISLRFDAPLNPASLSAPRLAVRGANVADRPPVSVAYDPATRTATWTLAAPVGADRLLLDLDAESPAGVRDEANRLLDGEYATGNLPSGDGIAGGNFLFRLNVLPGDVNGTGRVRLGDSGGVRSRLLATAASPRYDPRADVDADGQIRLDDLDAVNRALATALPGGTATAGAVPLVGEVRVADFTPSQVTLTWPPASGGAGGPYLYTLQRAVVNAGGSAGPYADVRSAGTSATTFTDRTVTPGASYRWRLRAADAANIAGTGAASPSVLTNFTYVPTTIGTGYAYVSARGGGSFLVTATGPNRGAAPYSRTWHRAPTHEFTPDAGNQLAGQTDPSLFDTPAGQVYWRAAAADAVGRGAFTNPVPSGPWDAPVRLGMIGSSTMVGLAAPYVNYLRSVTPGRSVSVTNRAVNNSTVSAPGTWQLNDAWYRDSKAAFAAAGVQWVVVMLGANDATLGYPAATYAARMREMVTDLAAAGFRVLLSEVGVSRVSSPLLRQYNAALDAMCDERTVFRGDRQAFDYFAANWPAEIADNSHPNSIGQASYARMHMTALEAALHRAGVYGPTGALAATEPAAAAPERDTNPPPPPAALFATNRVAWARALRLAEGLMD